jgi:hypothetical protein
MQHFQVFFELQGCKRKQAQYNDISPLHATFILIWEMLFSQMRLRKPSHSRIATIQAWQKCFYIIKNDCGLTITTGLTKRPIKIHVVTISS